MGWGGGSGAHRVGVGGPRISATGSEAASLSAGPSGGAPSTGLAAGPVTGDLGGKPHE